MNEITLYDTEVGASSIGDARGLRIKSTHLVQELNVGTVPRRLSSDWRNVEIIGCAKCFEIHEVGSLYKSLNVMNI